MGPVATCDVKKYGMRTTHSAKRPAVSFLFLEQQPLTSLSSTNVAVLLLEELLYLGNLHVKE
ncbi:hypothetical protein K2173_002260 [Erythroxylum novogranatense]|uniref:Uncharacterized protein n=1 Tax=Erythroxylum novogranatense TaxID=1862640 RepID=A0AAV8T990_9ROSI|nr:hypothetical protein K2173_002260 [Erythroxylum novogranatense]